MTRHDGKHEDEPPVFGVTSNAITLAERVLTKWGLATLLAIGLVWWIASDVSGTQHRIEAKLDTHMNESAYYLRAICLHTAKDESERAGCIPLQQGH